MCGLAASKGGQIERPPLGHGAPNREYLFGIEAGGRPDAIATADQQGKEEVVPRKLLPLALIVLAAIVVPVAWANPPTITHFPDSTDTETITDLCTSPVTLTFALTNETEIDFSDQSGNLTAIHLKFFEQDTFVGPTGDTLVGEPYTGEVQILFDGNGNITNIYGDGTLEKVQLPDGGLFVSAGRVDFVARGVPFVFTPDTGHSGNVAGFCAALGA